MQLRSSTVEKEKKKLFELENRLFRNTQRRKNKNEEKLQDSRDIIKSKFLSYRSARRQGRNKENTYLKKH